MWGVGDARRARTPYRARMRKRRLRSFCTRLQPSPMCPHGTSRRCAFDVDVCAGAGAPRIYIDTFTYMIIFKRIARGNTQPTAAHCGGHAPTSAPRRAPGARSRTHRHAREWSFGRTRCRSSSRTSPSWTRRASVKDAARASSRESPSRLKPLKLHLLTCTHTHASHMRCNEDSKRRGWPRTTSFPSELRAAATSRELAQYGQVCRAVDGFSCASVAEDPLCQGVAIQRTVTQQ